MEKLNEKDEARFLCCGKLTQPFLDDNYVIEKVLIDFNSKIKAGKPITKIESLLNWIYHNVKYAIGEDDFIKKFKFQRTAKEIWQSKKVTGCTDYAILFSTFARQIGIPTTFLHTAEYNWLQNLKCGKCPSVNCGHSFCECYYEGQWILVDPTYRKIEYKYDLNIIDLHYSVGGSTKFVPYFRGLDLGEKQTMENHNKFMNEKCKQLNI